MKKLLLFLLFLSGAQAVFAMKPTSANFFNELIRGDKNDIKKLLIKGINPNSAYKGFLPLSYTNNIATMKLLLDYGANVDGKNGSGITALEHAIDHNNFDAVALLCAYKATLSNGKISCTIALPSHFDIALLLLHEGLNPCVQNNIGNVWFLSPLQWAIIHSNTELLAAFVLNNPSLDLSQWVDFARNCKASPDTMALCIDFEGYLLIHPNFEQNVREKMIAIKERIRHITLKDIQEKHGYIPTYLQDRQIYGKKPWK